MAQGMSDSGIAESLYVSAKTVETHVRHILTKLDLPLNTAENRGVLAVIAYLLGWAKLQKETASTLCNRNYSPAHDLIAAVHRAGRRRSRKRARLLARGRGPRVW